MHIIDVHDPQNILQVRVVDTPDTAYNLHIVDSVAYVADQCGGLRIIDIQNPEIASEIAFFQNGYYFRDVFVSYPYAYLAAASHGLVIVDVTDPYHQPPSYVNELDLEGFAGGIYVSGDYAYVLHGHTHYRADWWAASTRVLNPGALGGTKRESRSVCILDLETGQARFIEI